MNSEKTSRSVSVEGNTVTKQTKTNHPLKARLFIGGLKSLFGDMHDMLEEVEKTGQMSRDMITSLTDVHEAIDLAVDELKKVMSPCCDHSPDAHQCDDSCEDETTTVLHTGKVGGVKGSSTQPLGGSEAFVVEEGEEDDQEPVEEIQGQGKASCGVCECSCDEDEYEDEYEYEEEKCDEVSFPPSLRGPSPSDFSSMEMDPEDIPYDSKRHLRVIRHNAPSGTFPTEEDFSERAEHWRGIVLKHPLSNITPVDDPLGEKEEDDVMGERLPAVKKQPKKKSKTKK